MNLYKRFVDKFDIGDDDECWEWNGAIKSGGYGSIRTSPKFVEAAHRLSYMFFVGDPGEMQVLHKCDNRKCVNPSHLFLGTHADNMRDRWEKRRYKMPDLYGSRHYATKVSEEGVETIRKLYASHVMTQQELADMYGVTQSAISNIVNRKRRRRG